MSQSSTASNAPSLYRRFSSINRVARPAGVTSTESDPSTAFLSRASSSIMNSFHERRRSSEVTRNPRSMKNLNVVCHAGPRPSIVPRPRPSRFQRNSFSPFDMRVVSCISDALGAPIAPTVRLVGVVRPPIGIPDAGRETLRVVPAPIPIPSLLKSPIARLPSPPPCSQPSQRRLRSQNPCPPACPLPLFRGAPPHLPWPVGRFALPAGAAPAGVVGISETPCGFASSFFHTRHLDPVFLVFRSRIRVRLEGTRLGIVKIIQGLLDVKRNTGNQI